MVVYILALVKEMKYKEAGPNLKFLDLSRKSKLGPQFVVCTKKKFRKNFPELNI